MSQKVALVTGGSRGIGAEAVKALARDGYKVYLTYRSGKAEAEALAKELKFDSSQVLACDVKSAESVRACVETVVSKEDRLDVLVNSAGVIKDNLFLALSDEDWDEVLDTNLGGTYRFCKAVVRTMLVQRSGSIINVSSVVGEYGGFGQTNYAASKGAINAFTRGLAAELASRNITVNAVAPGMVETDMSAQVRAMAGDKIKERIPAGRFAKPAEIAELVAFLASDRARYITGQVITADGGLSLLGRK